MSIEPKAAAGVASQHRAHAPPAAPPPRRRRRSGGRRAPQHGRAAHGAAGRQRGVQQSCSPFAGRSMARARPRALRRRSGARTCSALPGSRGRDGRRVPAPNRRRRGAARATRQLSARLVASASRTRDMHVEVGRADFEARRIVACVHAATRSAFCDEVLRAGIATSTCSEVRRRRPHRTARVSASCARDAASNPPTARRATGIVGCE